MYNIIFFIMQIAYKFFKKIFIFILSGKNGRSLCFFCSFFGCSTSISTMYIFIIKPASNFNLFFFHSKLSRGNFQDIAHPYIVFRSQYIKYDDSLMTCVFIICLFLLMNCHIPPLILFSTICGIFILVNNSNAISVFVKLP